MPDYAVQRFNGVGRVDYLTDVRWVGEERGQIGPVCLPTPAYLGIAVAPGTGERFQSLLASFFRRGLMMAFRSIR